MFKKYFGIKKKELIEKKINNKNGYKLVVTDWVDDVLTKTEHFFDTIDEAKTEGDKKFGSIKIYDRENKLIHSQKNDKNRGKGNGHTQHGQGHGFGHDHHEDETYA